MPVFILGACTVEGGLIIVMLLGKCCPCEGGGGEGDPNNSCSCQEMMMHPKDWGWAAGIMAAFPRN